MAMKYEIIPRYSGGSPAMVDHDTAQRVLAQEREMFEAHRNGFYGAEGEATAKEQGMEGIVLITDGRKYFDVATARDYGEMPLMAIRYPEKLVVRKFHGRAVYFFRRRLLAEAKLNRDRQISMVPILYPMENLFQIDRTSRQLHDLWNAKDVVE